MARVPLILTVAGSDSGGGAGIQADLKTIAAHQCYGMTALTAITAQNTKSVIAVEPISPELVRQQIRAVVYDIGVDVIKLGMLHNEEIINVVAEELQLLPESVPIVLDPVMVATSGDRLLDLNATGALIKKLCPLVWVITPNFMEVNVLLGRSCSTAKEIETAACDLLKAGPKVVVVKGGDHPQEKANDCIASAYGVQWLREDVVLTDNTHGTGCTLSTAIACYMAKGHDAINAVKEAKKFVTTSLINNRHVHVGKGKGPVLPVLPAEHPPLPISYLTIW